MGKAELIKNISAHLKVCPEIVEIVLEGLKDELIRVLEADKTITYSGFFTAKMSKRKERKGYNPVTGKTELYPEMKSPLIKFSSVIKKTIEESYHE